MAALVFPLTRQRVSTDIIRGCGRLISNAHRAEQEGILVQIVQAEGICIVCTL